jgi:Aerotolerance regulator N-terminal/von Willebrand factor type A domain
MTFLHFTLLFGGLAAIAPVLLHMLGRRQPKPIVFPAIRFVRQSAVTAQRGWSIKRWLLLALRVIMVVLLALALSSPRVHSNMFATYLLIGLIGMLALLATAVALTAFGSRRGLPTTIISAAIALALWGVGGTWLGLSVTGGPSVGIPSASGPIAVAVVIDTSPSMGYKYHNVTRLEAAKEMATWLMDRLPVGSQIAIVNNDIGVRLNQDRVSANRQLDRTVVEGKATNLIQRISSSVDVLRKSELERREIYVLSDLSMPAWRDADTSDLPKKLARNEEGKGVEGENVLLQIIDVSVPVAEIRNWSLGNFKLSQQSTTPGSQVTISAEVMSVKGSGTEQMSVELVSEVVDRSQLDRDPKASAPTTRVVDRQLVEVPDGGSLPVQMTLKDLSEGTNHAELRLTRPDPLECDNVVYVSVDARTQGQTLVICDDKSDADYLSAVINSWTDAPPAEGMCKLCTSTELDKTDLTRFSSILLFDPGVIQADTIDLLDDWVAKGGGLMIVLASSFESADALMDSPISKLLPGKVTGLASRSISDRSVKLSYSIKNHPIWIPFAMAVDDIPWVTFSVFRNWEIKELDAQSVAIMRFTGNELPAIVEQVRKQGRIVTFMLPTFPEPERHDTPDKKWTQDLNGWLGWALLQGTLDYLGSWNSQQLNYFVDEPAVLENNTAQFPQLYKMLSPQNEETRVESNEESLVYTFTRFPGQYRLRGQRPQGTVVRGFSVNVDRKESSLERILPAVLDKAIGKDLYRVAKDRDEVQSSLGEGRYGRDLSPFLLMIFVMMIMAEQTMSSRFYAQSKRAGA